MKKKPIKKSTLFKKLGSFRNVWNMDSNNGYGCVENQFEIGFDNGRVFQSYNTVIAAWIYGQLYLNEYYHDYSNTTMKYCKHFTGMTAQQRRDGIKNGTIRTFET